MYKSSYNVLGVMSGTSLDGVDIANLSFSNTGKWYWQILEAETIPYSNDWLVKLKNAVNFSESEIYQLNIDYTHYLADLINNFISTNKLKNIDAICSHGHTVLHKPHLGITLQIGNLPIISNLTHHKVVCDFRVQDINLGGQGAPLVPIGDRMLFYNYDYCINLGGFSNISFEDDFERVAFDISPVNTVLNYFAQQLGYEYDDKGIIAKSGNFNRSLFDNLNAIDYYQKKFPKSLGVEFVNERILTSIRSFQISIPDILNTFSEHIAFQISKVITDKKATLLFTGGGVYNEYLMNRVKYFLPNSTIIIPNSKTIQYKEALIFGFLGVLKLRNEINVLSSVTGASHDHTSGKVFNFNS
ncbi:MAG TPA: anhydro-N-acetylmuramic acid kinase [Flavobacterium sp.]|nr:anhydro-N-acetylmuramic acid kinase [Flavobacterium sp.]